MNPPAKNEKIEKKRPAMIDKYNKRSEYETVYRKARMESVFIEYELLPLNR